jgi:phospholipase C
VRISKIARRLCNRSVVTAAILALVGAQTGLAATAPSGPSFGPNNRDLVTHTPIKHVIIIIGENWSFDSVFATYQPKVGETVLNLLSQGIVKADGTPGASYSKSKQSSATDNGTYKLAPPLPDVARARLLRSSGDHDQSVGLPRGSLSLG